MQRWSRGLMAGGVLLLVGAAVLTGRPGDESSPETAQFTAPHSDCSYFGADRERFVDATLRTSGGRLLTPLVADQPIPLGRAHPTVVHSLPPLP